MNANMIPRPIIDLICHCAGGHIWEDPQPIGDTKELLSYHHSIQWERRCSQCGKTKRFTT